MDDVFVEVVEMAQEIIRLKDLNRELVAMLKELPGKMLQSSSPFCPYCQ